MTFHSAKETLTREEVLDILRRNVKLYKNEPEFVNYIVDLALYLLENTAKEHPEDSAKEDRELGRLMAGSSVQIERVGLPSTGAKTPANPSAPLSPPLSSPASSPGPQMPATKAAPIDENRLPRVKVDKGGKTRVYKVFRSHTNTIESLHCPICGSETRGERTCPNCGNVL